MRSLVLIFIVILFGCTNQYKRFGVETHFDRNKYLSHKQDHESKSILIEFTRDDFKISNREIIICFDTSIIYLGNYFHGKKNISVPVQLTNKKLDLNLFIIEPGGDKAYYFESKEPLLIKSEDNLIQIKLSKEKEFSDRIQAIVSKI